MPLFYSNYLRNICRFSSVLFSPFAPLLTSPFPSIPSPPFLSLCNLFHLFLASRLRLPFTFLPYIILPCILSSSFFLIYPFVCTSPKASAFLTSVLLFARPNPCYIASVFPSCCPILFLFCSSPSLPLSDPFQRAADEMVEEEREAAGEKMWTRGEEI